MTVKEIVTEYLKAHGYDGLYTLGCACLTGELFVGCDGSDVCRPGYAQPCDCDAPANCTHIGPKPANSPTEEALDGQES